MYNFLPTGWKTQQILVRVSALVHVVHLQVAQLNRVTEVATGYYGAFRGVHAGEVRSKCSGKRCIWSRLSFRWMHLWAWKILEDTAPIKIGGERKLQAVSVKLLCENTGNECCPLKGGYKGREEGIESKTHEWHKDTEGYNLLQEIIFWARMVRGGRGDLWYRKETEDESDRLFLPITQLMRKKAKPPVLFSLGF